MKLPAPSHPAAKALRKWANPEKAKFLQRFFRSGPGEYAEGDRLIGVNVPQVRKVAKEYADIPLGDIKKLLSSEIHEERLLALIIMVNQYKSRHTTEEQRDRLHRLYLQKTKYVNNWDLVDCSAETLVGRHLDGKNKSLLTKLSGSKLLWERRISIMATFHEIKQGRGSETLRIATRLLRDDHDLIHKAVGWMLREWGKRDLKSEEAFLKKHYQKMPRTMLRYAIEKFPERRRRAYIEGRI